MEKLIKFLKTDNGKLAAVLAGAAFLLLILWVISPNTINMCINNGENCAVSTKSAKRISKGKRRKNKKNKRS